MNSGDEKQIDSEDEVVVCIGEGKVHGRMRWCLSNRRLPGDEEFGLTGRTLGEIFKPTKNAKRQAAYGILKEILRRGDRMPIVDKILAEVMRGTQDKNIRFSELQKLLEALGFQCRIKGDHFIYYKNGVDEIIIIQPDGNKAKAYQVKQVRSLILKYKMEV